MTTLRLCSAIGISVIGINVSKQSKDCIYIPTLYPYTIVLETVVTVFSAGKAVTQEQEIALDVALENEGRLELAVICEANTPLDTYLQQNQHTTFNTHIIRDASLTVTDCSALLFNVSLDTSLDASLIDSSLQIQQLRKTIVNHPHIPVIVIIDNYSEYPETFFNELFSIGAEDYFELSELTDKQLRKAIHKAKQRIHGKNSTKQNLATITLANHGTTNTINLNEQTAFYQNLTDIIKYSLNEKLSSKLFAFVLQKSVEAIDGAEGGTLLFLSDDNSFHYVAAHNYDFNLLKKINFSPQQIFKDSSHPTPKLIYDFDHSTLDSEAQAILKNVELQSQRKVTLSTPIFYEGKPIAIINLDNFTNRNSFSQEALDFSKLLAEQLSALWKRYKLEQNLESEQSKLKLELAYRSEINSFIATTLAQSNDESIYQTMLEKAIAMIPNAQAGSVVIKVKNRYKFVAALGFDLNILSSILFNINDFKLPAWAQPEIKDYYDTSWQELSEQKRDTFILAAGSNTKIQSALSIPVIQDQEVVVIFNIDNLEQKNAFDESAKGIAQMFATHSGAIWQRMILENNLLEEQARLIQEASFRAELNSLMQEIFTQSQDEAIYQTMLEKAVDTIPGAEAGSMAVLTKEGNYQYSAAVGFNLSILSSVPFELQDFGSPNDWSQPILKSYVDDSLQRLEQDKIDVLTKAGPTNDIYSSLSIPILKNDDIIIIFNLDNLTSKHAFGEMSISMAQIFATHIEALWERIQLENNLRKEQKRLTQESSFRAELNGLMNNVLLKDSNEQIYQAMLEKAVDIIPNVQAGSMAILTQEGYRFVAAVEFKLDILSSITFELEDFGQNDNWSEPTIKDYFDNDNWHKLAKEKQDVFIGANNSNDVYASLSIPIVNNNKIVMLFNLDNIETKDAFDENTVGMAQMFATQISALWQRFKLENNLKDNEQRYKQLFIDADRSGKELELLSQLQHTIINKLELDELLESVVSKIASIFDFSGVCIGLVKDDTIVRGPTIDAALENDPIVRKLDQGIAGRVVRTKKPELIDNLATHPNIRPEHASQTSSTLAIPFCSDGEVLGILFVRSEDRKLEQRDLELMQKVIEQLELAIENAHLHEHVKTDLARTQALHSISESIHRADNLDALMQEVVETTREATKADWAILYKIDFEEEIVEHVVTSEHKQNPLKRLSFEQLKDVLTGWSIQHQQIIYLDKDSDDEREHPDVKARRLSLGFGSIIVAPLLYQNKALGVMALINHVDGEKFSDTDIQMVQQVSNQASLALAQHQLLQKTEYQAYHDIVTGLPNRFLFEDRLKQTLAHAKRYDNHFAVLFLDLDGFKNVNDTLGHDAGDLLLQEVATRLHNLIRESDTLARMGGDEFAIILDKLSNPDDAIRIAQDYRQVLQKSFHIDGTSLFINGSIGVSVYPTDGQDTTTLVKHADTAMYEAKSLGKNRVQSFTQVLADRTRERLELETHLRSAVENNTFQLYYQPKIDLFTGQCIGSEALIRWIDPVLGFIPPDKFISIAEETGLITPLGDWIVDEACRQTKLWHEQGLLVTTAVNISSVQFKHHNFVHKIQQALNNHNLEAHYLELEVTESMIMQDVNMVIQHLNQLRKLDVSIAIDDFGTGYSSLSYLQKLPLDYIKIDRSFVDEMDKLEHQKNLVQTIIALANNFKLKVIAEGVENEAQLQLLKAMGCQTAQGYYFSKPLSADEATSTMAKFNT